MSGVMKPGGLLGASVVIGHQASSTVLPFTGVALGVYAAIGTALVLAGVVLRIVGSRG